MDVSRMFLIKGQAPWDDNIRTSEKATVFVSEQRPGIAFLDSEGQCFIVSSPDTGTPLPCSEEQAHYINKEIERAYLTRAEY